MVTASQSADLTTTRAPFIEDARSRGDLYLPNQPYELYSAANHDTWRRLYARMSDRWARYANRHFLTGLDVLRLDPTRVPRLEDVNQFMRPLTGFRAKPVAGYVPTFRFFECLRNREFPTTITIRDGGSLDYLPEPDIFHDIAGHVPMHTDQAFAETLVRFGECVHIAADRARRTSDAQERVDRLASVLRAMARFFWFTIEFGLMRGPTPGSTTAYGSGLLSSFGELAHSVDAPTVQRVPFQLDWVINQYFEVNHYQPLFFVIESFDHLFEEVGRLEQRMKDGTLDFVAPGESTMSEPDVRAFLEHILA